MEKYEHPHIHSDLRCNHLPFSKKKNIHKIEQSHKLAQNQVHTLTYPHIRMRTNASKQ